MRSLMLSTATLLAAALPLGAWAQAQQAPTQDSVRTEAAGPEQALEQAASEAAGRSTGQAVASLLVIEGTQTTPPDLAGQTVYATGGDAGGATSLTEIPDTWAAVGVIEGISPQADVARIAFVEGALKAGEAATAEVGSARLRLIPAEGEASGYVVLFDAEGTPLAGQLEDAERDRLAELAAADGEVLQQSDAMTGSPVARGTDGLDDEGRPILGGPSAEGGPAAVADDATGTAAVAGEPATPAGAIETADGGLAAETATGLATGTAGSRRDETDVASGDLDATAVGEGGTEVSRLDDAMAEAATEPGESGQALREVDIADPTLPPIEDAQNVIPETDLGEAEVPAITAETEVTSPSTTTALPGATTDQAIAETSGPAGATALMRPDAAPEGFAPADIAIMDPTELLGVQVYSADGELVGEIGRWLGEAEGRLPAGAVVDIGGVLGLGERNVAFDAELMTLMAGASSNDLRVYVPLTQSEIEALPEATE